MESTNIVIDGRYKGYKIVFDKSNNCIQLKHKKEKILLDGNITSICITNTKLENKTIHYFQIRGSAEKIHCLLDFNTYILLLIIGMKAPMEVLG